MRPTSTPIYLLLLAIALIFLVAWAGTVALVYWDTRRRKLDRLQRWLGIGLAAALPVAGFFAYWMILLISHWMRPIPPAQTPESPRRRVTQPMAALRSEGVRTTIPAAEMILQSTNPFPAAPPPARPVATAGRPVFHLHVTQGPNAGADFPLSYFPAAIGRSSAALVLLDKDLKVSRQHAEIYEDQGALRIRDLGSLHGTQVNGLTIQDQALRSEDHIQIGASVLVFQVAER
jgi:hypothetical protein